MIMLHLLDWKGCMTSIIGDEDQKVVENGMAEELQ